MCIDKEMHGIPLTLNLNTSNMPDLLGVAQKAGYSTASFKHQTSKSSLPKKAKDKLTNMHADHPDQPENLSSTKPAEEFWRKQFSVPLKYLMCQLLHTEKQESSSMVR